MSAYRLVERDLFTNQALTVWDSTTDGEPLTASAASDLVGKVRAENERLRATHAKSYLEVESIQYGQRTQLLPLVGA